MPVLVALFFREIPVIHWSQHQFPYRNSIRSQTCDRSTSPCFTVFRPLARLNFPLGQQASRQSAASPDKPAPGLRIDPAQLQYVKHLAERTVQGTGTTTHALTSVSKVCVASWILGKTALKAAIYSLRSYSSQRSRMSLLDD